MMSIYNIRKGQERMKTFKRFLGVILFILLTYTSWILGDDKMKKGIAIMGLIMMFVLSIYSIIGGI